MRMPRSAWARCTPWPEQRLERHRLLPTADNLKTSGPIHRLDEGIKILKRQKAWQSDISFAISLDCAICAASTVPWDHDGQRLFGIPIVGKMTSCQCLISRVNWKVKVGLCILLLFTCTLRLYNWIDLRCATVKLLFVSVNCYKVGPVSRLRDSLSLRTIVTWLLAVCFGLVFASPDWPTYVQPLQAL